MVAEDVEAHGNRISDTWECDEEVEIHLHRMLQNHSMLGIARECNQAEGQLIQGHLLL
jgi:hypothetical protein